jgi:hypothetical protein
MTVADCALCGRWFDPAARPCGVRGDLCSQDCQNAADLQRQWDAVADVVVKPKARQCSGCGRATTSRKEPPVCSQCQYHSTKTDRRRNEIGSATPERIAELAARAEAGVPTVYLFGEEWRGI